MSFEAADCRFYTPPLVVVSSSSGARFEPEKTASTMSNQSFVVWEIAVARWRPTRSNWKELARDGILTDRAGRREEQPSVTKDVWEMQECGCKSTRTFNFEAKLGR